MADERRRAGPFQILRAVFWSFFGVRKRADYEDDSVKLTPGQVIAAGLAGAVLLVLTLIFVVRLVTG